MFENVFTPLLLLLTVQDAYPQLNFGPVSGPIQCRRECVGGFVPGTCLCRRDPSPFIFPESPCEIVKCQQGQVCQMEAGETTCVTPAVQNPTAVDECSLPADPGPCEALKPRYFFDSTDGTCKTFNYGGCQGNGNRFGSKVECENACKTNAAPVGGVIKGSESISKVPDIIINGRIRIPDIVIKRNEICSLPVSSGMCLAYIPSFFFNSTSGQCQSFIYGGCGGNQNRFSSLQACQEACGREAPVTEPVVSPNPDCNLPKIVGPCRAARPSFYYNTSTGQCKGFIYGGCRGNANRFQTQSECEQQCKQQAPGSSLPSTGSRNTVISANSDCNLPKVTGLCKAYIPSFFYNTNTGKCDSFVYGGCGGNANRFQTQSECEQQCKQSASGSSVPSTGSDSTVLSANTDCNLPKTVGMCRAYVPSFYYNINTGQCEMFVYGGCEGNANRFQTQSECQQQCKQQGSGSSLPSTGSVLSANMDCNLPKTVGPCEAYMPSFFYNTHTGQCERFVYGGCEGNANRFQTQSECEQQCKQQGSGSSLVLSPNSDCNLPRVVGFCRAYFPSFYYNTNTGRCEGFVYGGCGGNANRFQTQSECEQKCKQTDTISPVQVRDTACFQPRTIGHCKARMPRYFFDQSSQTCQLFFYGGCGGNDNNFRTQAECERRCATSLAVQDACSMPKVSGPCFAAFPRYYYDTTTGRCRRFTYGGCHGNQNNFRGFRACRRKCGGR